jgi:cell division septum initiation protein DivIVA
MLDDSTKIFNINESELKQFLDLIEKIIVGLCNTKKISKKERDSLRIAVIETCKSIKIILQSIVKELDKIVKDIKNNKKNVKFSVSQLSYNLIWEEKYKLFRLCIPFRNAISELRDIVFGKLSSFFLVSDSDELCNLFNTCLSTKSIASDFASYMLKDLSKLSDDIKSKKDYVIQKIKEALNIVNEYRAKFTDMEILIHIKI